MITNFLPRKRLWNGDQLAAEAKADKARHVHPHIKGKPVALVIPAPLAGERTPPTCTNTGDLLQQLCVGVTEERS